MLLLSRTMLVSIQDKTCGTIFYTITGSMSERNIPLMNCLPVSTFANPFELDESAVTESSSNMVPTKIPEARKNETIV
jgi:hypothetical protein